MTELNLYLTKNGVFVPADDSDYEKAHAMQRERTYKCRIPDDRNTLFNRKYHKLFDVAWQGLTETQTAIFHENKTAFKHSVEMEAGCIEPIFDFKTMQPSYIRASTNYEKMSEKDFQDLYERVKDVLLNIVFRKCKDKEFLNMIMTF